MRALLLFLSVLTAPAVAADFTGRVLKVQDGDIITVLVNRQRVRVRLESIDAPELDQAFGNRSRRSLADICATKLASVVRTGKDRYGRTLGWVTCAGVEANSAQVRRGMAWVFARYVGASSPLYELEAYARLRQIGLWVDSQPVAPWEWRTSGRAGKDL